MIEKINKTFYEITGNRLNNTSQLKLFNIIRDIKENENLLNIFKSYKLGEDITSNVFYSIYEVDNNDWWENISYVYYGTPYLWWVIAIINDVVNPFEYLEVGSVIKILKPEYIYQILKEIKNIGEL